MQKYTFGEIENKLKNIYAQYLSAGTKDDLDVDKPFDEYNINSVDYLKIIVGTEIEFGFDFDDDDLAIGKFKKMRDIIEYILSKESIAL